MQNDLREDGALLRRFRLVTLPRCGMRWPSGRAVLRPVRPNMKITRRLSDRTRRYEEVR